jgi:hypothetical protein
MSQDQIDRQMQKIMNAEAAGEITEQELEAHLETIRKLLTEETGA